MDEHNRLIFCASQDDLGYLKELIGAKISLIFFNSTQHISIDIGNGSDFSFTSLTGGAIHFETDTSFIEMQVGFKYLGWTIVGFLSVPELTWKAYANKNSYWLRSIPDMKHSASINIGNTPRIEKIEIYGIKDEGVRPDDESGQMFGGQKYEANIDLLYLFYLSSGNLLGVNIAPIDDKGGVVCYI